MKISNILLIITLSIFFLVTLSSNFVLKNKFDQIDKDDKFYGFSKHPVGAFKYLHLKGKGFGLTEIQQGPHAEIRMITLPKYLEWKTSGDTLVVTYKADWKQGYQPHDAFGSLPSIYIVAPQLEGIVSDSIRSKVKNYKFGDLAVDQKGDALMLDNASVRNLKVTISKNGYIRLNPECKIEMADVDIHDNSTFNAEKDVFGNFDALIDSSAYISLPGSMIKKMMREQKLTPR